MTDNQQTSTEHDIPSTTSTLYTIVDEQGNTHWLRVAQEAHGIRVDVLRDARAADAPLNAPGVRATAYFDCYEGAVQIAASNAAQWGVSDEPKILVPLTGHSRQAETPSGVMEHAPDDRDIDTSGLFVAVEFDRDYFGGDYHGVGDTILIPHNLVRACGGDVPRAFEALTRYDRKHIIHYSENARCDAVGEEDPDAEDFDAPAPTEEIDYRLVAMPERTEVNE